MIEFLLDTNVCIQLLNHRYSEVARKLVSLRRDRVTLCSIVRAELYYGAYRSSRREENLALLRRFFEEFRNLPFDGRCEEIYGRTRAQLTEKGALIGPNDLLIASVALAHDLTLVTNNVTEFGRVSGLRIEDWQGTARP